MQLSRLFAATFVVSIASVATIVSCGGDDGGTGGPDANHGSDAGHHDSTPGSDATPGSDGSSGVAGLGTTCTPDGSGGQGDCPTGFVCLALQDATNPFCSKTCDPSNDTCGTGYTGTGVAACIFGVSDGSGGSATDYCSVVCEDDTGTHAICSASVCNDTCPGALQCSAPLMNGSGMTVAKGCE